MRAFLSLLLIAGCGGDDAAMAPDAGTDGAVPDASSAFLLQPGEVAELVVDEDGVAGEVLATPSGTERFVLVLGSTDFELVNDALPFSITFDDAANAGPTEIVTTCSLPSGPWSTPPAVDPPPTGPAPAMGSTRDIDVPGRSGATTIVGQAIAVGDHAVVWADTTNPTTLDAEFVAQFLDDFENVIMPRERAVVGTEPDLDGDGRIHLVFSALTYDTAVAFFTGCDLQDGPGCPSSNGGEYLYLTPPDVIDPPYNTADAIKEILAHEMSHLLHFNRKVLENGLTQWPDSSYLVEGVGALAQDVAGYQAGNLYVTLAGLDGINDFSLADIVVDERPYDASRDGVLRGASYLFVRFLYDRGGGDSVDGAALQSLGGPAILRAMVDSPASMTAALPDLAGTSMSDVGMDFYTALAMSNRDEKGGAAPANPCFAYLPIEIDPVTANQRGSSMFATFHGFQMNGPQVSDATQPDERIRRGGVEFLVFNARSGESEIAFTVDIHPQALPRVRVGRWK